MDTRFNVFDVLRIAEEVEHKAAGFYLQTARQFVDSQRRSVCYDLASWRVRHQRTWSRIRQAYSEKTGEFGRFDPDNYVSSNPQVMAGLTWFGVDLDSRRRLLGQETEQEILRDALRRANGILIFYRGLKDFACDAASRMMIDNMISEEERHTRLLTQSLDRVRTPIAGLARSASLCAAV